MRSNEMFGSFLSVFWRHLRYYIHRIMKNMFKIFKHWSNTKLLNILEDTFIFIYIIYIYVYI